MLCPYCESKVTRVVDTRKFDTVVIRIRVCDTCRMSFQTEEIIQPPIPAKIEPNKDKMSI